MKRKIKKDWNPTPGFHHMKFLTSKFPVACYRVSTVIASEAKQSHRWDCFVVSLLAMTARTIFNLKIPCSLLQGVSFLKTISVSLFFMLAFVTFCLNTYGYDDDSPGKWWKNKKVVNKLELSNDQVNRIEGIFSSNKGRIKELDSDLKKKEREFSDTVKNPNSSREEILKMNNEVEEVKGKLRKAYIDMRLQIRDVLTPEQRTKLQEIRTKHGKPYP